MNWGGGGEVHAALGAVQKTAGNVAAKAARVNQYRRQNNNKGSGGRNRAGRPGNWQNGNVRYGGEMKSYEKSVQRRASACAERSRSNVRVMCEKRQTRGAECKRDERWREAGEESV